MWSSYNCFKTILRSPSLITERFNICALTILVIPSYLTACMSAIRRQNANSVRQAADFHFLSFLVMDIMSILTRGHKVCCVTSVTRWVVSAESERERRGPGELENRSLWRWGWQGGEWRTLASLIGFFHPKTKKREILRFLATATTYLFLLA